MAKTKQIKVGVVIPSIRKGCNEDVLKLIERQTLKPDFIENINFENESGKCDITKRYRQGIEALKDKVDLILFIEDDDIYFKEYIETIVKAWDKEGRPDVMGLKHTIHYDIVNFKYVEEENITVCPAMCTAVTASALNILPNDNEPCIESFIWTSNLKKSMVKIDKTICLKIHDISMVSSRKINFFNKKSGFIHENEIKNDENKEFLGSINP